MDPLRDDGLIYEKVLRGGMWRSDPAGSVRRVRALFLDQFPPAGDERQVCPGYAGGCEMAAESCWSREEQNLEISNLSVRSALRVIGRGYKLARGHAFCMPSLTAAAGLVPGPPTPDHEISVVLKRGIKRASFPVITVDSACD